MAAALTSFALNWMNRWYMKLDRVHAASIKGSPWLKRVKFENTGGEAVAQPFVLYGHRGDSGDLATAQGISANQRGGSRKLRWLVPYGTYEGSVRVPHKDIALSRKDKDAAARAMQFDADLVLKQRGANIVRLFFGSAGYSLVSAVRAYSTVTSKITFGTAAECSNVIPGDELVISLSNGTSASHVLVPGSGVGYVIARDLKSLTVTIANTPNATVASNPTNWTTTSFFYFRSGEFLPGTNDMITPLQAYLPPAPASDTLFNVDRSIDTILSGYQVADASLTGKGILQRIKRVVNEHREQLGYLAEDSEIDCGYINPVEWGAAEEELASTNYRQGGSTQTASEGYQFLEIVTANGPFRLISEPQVPRGVVFLLAQDDIAWHTPTGTIAEMIDDDGSVVSRMAGSNDLEMRPVSYIAVKMRAPFKHARLSTTV